MNPQFVPYPIANAPFYPQQYYYPQMVNPTPTPMVVPNNAMNNVIARESQIDTDEKLARQLEKEINN